MVEKVPSLLYLLLFRYASRAIHGNCPGPASSPPMMRVLIDTPQFGPFTTINCGCGLASDWPTAGAATSSPVAITVAAGRPGTLIGGKAASSFR